MNPDSSEDQPVEYLHLQHNHTHYSGVKVPLSEALEMVGVETEDQEGLQTGRGRKRKAGKHKVLTPNRKKVKVEEGLQDQSSIKLQQQKPRRTLKAQRRISRPQIRENSEDIVSAESLADPFALSPTKSHDNVKPARYRVLESGPQVDLPPDYSPLPLSEEIRSYRETFITNKEMFESTYKELEMIGHGGFGRVFKAVRLLDSKPVAIKHVPREKVTYTSLYGQCRSEVSEVLLMQNAAGKRGVDSLPNPAVIGFEEVIDLEDEVLIIMECLVDAVNLCDFITSSTQPLLEHEAKSIIKQVLDAAVIMHHNGVFHRDIKADNILVSFNDQRPSVKIIDFGCADWLSDTLYNTFTGTLPYAPPEFLFDNEYQAEQTTVWQIGLLLSNLFTDDRYDTWDHVIGPQCTIDNLSQQGNAFLSWCLTVLPYCRPKLEDLQHHPWFHGLTPP